MPKLVLNPLANLVNEQTAVNTINNNSDLITNAIENTLSRDGTSPNQMGADLDMNSNNIINLPYPATSTEPWRLQDQLDFIDDYDFSALWNAVAASELARDEAEDARDAAQLAESGATTQAGIATTQAGISTTQAGIATTQAGNALTSANNAAASALISSNNATVIAGMKYSFDASTSMADPGIGLIRFNNATVASVTAIAIDDQSSDAGNPDQSDYINTWASSTNPTIKGQITLRKLGTPATFVTFNITGLTDNAGWSELAVTHVASNGTWFDSDLMSIQFTRTGDKGADGLGTGDVVGPSSSVDNEIALFDSTTGKLIKRANQTGVLKATSGVIGTASASDITPLVSSATSTTQGIVELATPAEVATGTDTDRAATPSAIAGAAIYGTNPVNSQTTAYTLVASDQSKTIIHPSSDNNARTFTIPSNASVPFPLGTTITFVNLINTLTISIDTDTLTLAPSGGTGSRTLAANGVATILKIGTVSWIITGVGLS